MDYRLLEAVRPYGLPDKPKLPGSCYRLPLRLKKFRPSGSDLLILTEASWCPVATGIHLVSVLCCCDLGNKVWAHGCQARPALSEARVHE